MFKGAFTRKASVGIAVAFVACLCVFTSTVDALGGKKTKSPYTTLGLKKDANPDNLELSRAFRTMTTLFEGYSKVNDASDAASALGNAFDVLRDPLAREAIDAGASVETALSLISPPSGDELPLEILDQAELDKALGEAGGKPVLLYACETATAAIARAQRRLVALHGNDAIMTCGEAGLLHDVDLELYERHQLVGALPLGQGEGQIITTDAITKLVSEAVKFPLTHHGPAEHLEGLLSQPESQKKMWVAGLVLRGAEWCEQCARMLPELRRLGAELAPAGIQVSLFDCESGSPDCPESVTAHGLVALRVVPCGENGFYDAETISLRADTPLAAAGTITRLFATFCAGPKPPPPPPPPPKRKPVARVPPPVKKRVSNAVVSQRNLDLAIEAMEEGWGAYRQGRHDNAAANFERAIKFNPGSGGAHFGFAMALEGLGHAVDAIAAYERAINAGGIDLAVAHNNVGNLLRKQGSSEFERAEKHLLQSVKVAEAEGRQFYYPHKNLGTLYEKSGFMPEAQSHFAKSVEMQPDGGLDMYARLLLPYVYESSRDMDQWHARFVSAVASLKREQFTIVPHMMEGVPQYYMSYHVTPNAPKLYADIAEIWKSHSEYPLDWTAPHVLKWAPPNRNGRVVDVGIGSFYFRAHSVSRMLMGMLKHIPRKNVRITLFHWGHWDSTCDQLKALVHKFIHMDRRPIPDMRQVIASEQLDIMIYAEIGMDPNAYSLAMARLAPVQMVMHGHAATSGLPPPIDHFVTYAGFEEGPSFGEAQSLYTENLIRLPGHTPLPLYYDIVDERAEPSAMTEHGRLSMRARFGIPAAANTYSCLQTLFKLTPHLDNVWKDILAADPNARILLKELPWTDKAGMKLLRRLANTINANDMHRVVMLPPLSDSDYKNIFAVVDVVIDSYPFGGHTSTMDALINGIPVVSLPAKVIAGRCGIGLLKMAGVPELIVDSEAKLVQTAVRVGTNPQYRASLSKTIKGNIPSLIRDKTSTMAWERLLVKAANRESLAEFEA